MMTASAPSRALNKRVESDTLLKIFIKPGQTIFYPEPGTKYVQYDNGASCGLRDGEWPFQKNADGTYSVKESFLNPQPDPKVLEQKRKEKLSITPNTFYAPNCDDEIEKIEMPGGTVIRKKPLP